MESVSWPPDAAAARHLLRHLDDPAALRRNPITARLLRDITLDARALKQFVRSALIAALDAIAPMPSDRSRSAERTRRLRAIVERCDLGGEPHRVVAADLGICARQFYRTRREAFVRLAQALLDESLETQPRVALATDTTSDTELQLSFAARFDSVGQFDRSRAVLKRLAEQPLDPLALALVTHRCVAALSDAGNVGEAHAILAKAQLQLARAACTGRELAIIRAELLAAQAHLSSRAGELQAAIHNGERALALLQPHLGSDVERVRQLAIELSTLLAGALCEAGVFERAIATVESAKALLDEQSDPASAATLFFQGCQAHVVLPWGLSKALQENGEALAIARRSGHARHEAIALANFCAIYFLRGEYTKAMQHGRQALLVSELVASPNDLAVLLLNNARVAIALGEPAHALDLLARAKIGATLNDHFRAMIDVVESEALTAAGRFEAARAAARRAHRIFEEHGSQKQLGITLCAEARAFAGLAKKHAAVAVIRGAITVAESFGSAYSLAQVYRASAEITGNKLHAAYAAEIDSALQA